MKFLIYFSIVVAILVGIGVAVSGPISKAIKEANKPSWRIDEASEGDIVSSVDATGTVRPVLSIQIGSFVSGPIIKLNAEFNQEVKKGELLAEIDPVIYEAARDRDLAALNNRYAELERIWVLLWQATREERRAMNLRKDNEGYISPSEIDQYFFSVESLLAQLNLADAAVKQAEANLRNSNRNVEFTKITAPEAGIIIDRKVEPGQTLASQFQTPELFTIAPQMREKMHVFADVDEVDIGKIIQAKEKNLPVKFTVESYPDELFEKDVRIAEVRYSSTETQNVVTYPVVVETPNPNLKLLPGMTATLEFEIDRRKNVVRIPNAAVRFLPDAKHVHPDDKSIVEGMGQMTDPDEEFEIEPTATEKRDAEIRRRTRHVWYLDGDLLRAKEIKVGLSDNRFTEVVSDNVEPGDKFVTGLKKKSGQ